MKLFRFHYPNTIPVLTGIILLQYLKPLKIGTAEFIVRVELKCPIETTNSAVPSAISVMLHATVEMIDNIHDIGEVLFVIEVQNLVYGDRLGFSLHDNQIDLEFDRFPLASFWCYRDQ